MPKIARCEPGDHLFEQPYLLPAHLRNIKKHSCQIAARPRKTLHISHRNGIAFQI
jgi:hypothetical protein